MSRVAVIKFAGRKQSFLEKAEYETLLRSGLALLAGGSDYSACLKKLIPKGSVGLKTNCLASWNPTLKPLADALTELIVKSSGIDENAVIIWERTNRELQRAGYDLNAASFGRRCLGTDTSGVGYDDDFQSSGNVSSLVTRILTRMVEHSINLPVLKDHSIAGLSAGLKNMYGAINNPNKYHANNCSPSAAHVNNLATIRGKHRLTIIDAVRVQYDRGPGFDKKYMDYFDGLIISEDPVAADRVAQEVLEYLRRKNNRPSLADTGRQVKYLDEAEKIGLGTADIDTIDVAVMLVDENGNEKPGELWP